MRLAGKNVVVTGGAHGIGRAYCEAMAEQGASVGIIDLDLEAAQLVADGINNAGGTAIAVRADVADFEQIGAAATQITELLGPVHGLVNNAGMLNVVPLSRSLFDEVTEEEWDRIFAVQAKGPWNCCRAFVPSMRQAGGGSIINISSSTVFLANPTRIHYVASKSSVIGFTRVLSRELGQDWIRVNTVCPGSTLSEEDPTPEVIEMREKPIAGRSLKRIQVPQDVVGMVLFLLSDESEYITGQTMVVEGGGVLH